MHSQNNRNLGIESLENRRLMAADLVAAKYLDAQAIFTKAQSDADENTSKQSGSVDRDSLVASRAQTTAAKTGGGAGKSASTAPDYVYADDGIHYYEFEGNVWGIDVPAGTEVYTDGKDFALVFPDGQHISATEGIVMRTSEDNIAGELINPDTPEDTSGNSDASTDADDSFHWAWEDEPTGEQDQAESDDSFHWAWEDEPENSGNDDTDDDDGGFHWAWEDDPNEGEDDDSADDDADPDGGTTGYQDPEGNSDGKGNSNAPGLPRVPGMEGDRDPSSDDGDQPQKPGGLAGGRGGHVTDPSPEDDASGGERTGGPAVGSPGGLVTDPSQDADVPNGGKMILSPVFVDALINGVGGLCGDPKSILA